MATRKIAYLTPLYFDEASCLGGGERYPVNLARGVVAADPRSEVTLLSFGDTAGTRRLGDRLTLRILPAHGRPAHPLDHVSWDLADAVASADLLHIHQAYTRSAELGLLLARLNGIPVCVTDHGGDASDLGKSVGHLELADRIIAYSRFGASLYPKTGTPILVIRGGVDAETFRPPEAPVPRRHVLYVGRLLPHKGVDRLVEAIPPGIPLVLCGRPYHAEYAATLRELARGKDVTFVDDADDDALRSLYQAAWATVLPSVYADRYGRTYRAPELMGLTLLESMACGTPVLASTVGALPEYVEEGKSGHLFGDVSDLRRRIAAMVADPGRVRAMGEEGRRLVEREYSLHVAGQALAACYRELIAGRRGRAA